MVSSDLGQSWKRDLSPQGERPRIPLLVASTRSPLHVNQALNSAWREMLFCVCLPVAGLDLFLVQTVGKKGFLYVETHCVPWLPPPQGEKTHAKALVGVCNSLPRGAVMVPPPIPATLYGQKPSHGHCMCLSCSYGTCCWQLVSGVTLWSTWLLPRPVSVCVRARLSRCQV